MSANEIIAVHIQNHVLTPTVAEVWIQVHVSKQTATTEVRGRLMGPRCPYATTIEVAYALRPLSQPPDKAGIWSRVIIPEPSWWDPQSPFLYEGPIELWESGECIDQQTLRHALRIVRRDEKGLTINGKSCRIRSIAVQEPIGESQLAMLHEEGYNVLDASASAAMVREQADRLGFLLLEDLSEPK